MVWLLNRASHPVLRTSEKNRVQRKDGRRSSPRPERRRINAKGSNQGNAAR
jgi:hypothetical protein